MPADVMLVVLLSAVLHAGWNALVKSGTDPVVDTVLVAMGAAAVGAALVTVLPLPAAASWPFLAGSVLIHQVYYGLLALAYRGGDLSLAYPVMRGTAPAITAVVAAAVLGEHPTPGGWAGMLLVSAGVLMLAAGASRTGKIGIRPVQYALLNAGVIVAYSLVDAVGVRRSGNALSYTAWLLFATGALFGALYAVRRGPALFGHLSRNIARGLAGGVCTLGAYSLVLWAMTRAPVAPVAALRETSIVFGALLAAGLLKERLGPVRTASILAVALGAVLIKAFGAL